MIRLLPIVIIVALILGGLGYWRYTSSKTALTTPSTASQSSLDAQPLEVPKTLPAATVDDRVKALEDLVTKLVAQVNTLKSSPQSTSSDTRLNTIESSITELKARVSALEKASPTTTTTSGKTTLYIPLGGSSNSWTNSDWTTLDEFQISIDPANYPGYTSMQLEAIIRVVDPSGTESIRLYNSTDGTAISSQLDTTSTTYALKTSSTFTLPTGAKTYKLQGKDTVAKEYYIQSARLKVNY